MATAILFPAPMTIPATMTDFSHRPIDETHAWQQVLARDASADGSFVYAVTSTGIFCRPTCPSRRPLKENVRFYTTTAEAEAAGFRACQRCEPTRVAAKGDPHAAEVRRAARLLAEKNGEAVPLEELASAVGLSRFALLRSFQRVLGVTPAEYARQQRRELLRGTLQGGQRSVTEAVYEAGFGSSSRVYESANATLGMSPTAMKAGGQGEMVRYALGAASGSAQSPESSLGRVLVAATDKGLCAVLFADDDVAALADLRGRLPKAELIRDDAALQQALTFALSRLTESPSAVMLPFHVRATAFQQRVWSALLAIPRGETRTYAQVAEAIGAPKAIRAVGTACGANPLAVVVPCHRVVGASGALTGYRWGKERKQKLLEMERGG
ncbi:DNA-O6-methylguanine--protein-cysteine S-methyltransferase /Transcriptional regulator Ada [Bryocella elongata]|uniref:methylated-DNA--[protein]-cysteine S-methyltransferase n=1 Tax=Bryocella elongata TaxID=863522 RepID=A0A1H6AAM4_9BACT|nr:DNA-O6-methylguanine--protein-cysteine S-methyltransferase /Transcriptional regulator Ada [Bryocella elongata]